MIKSLHIGRYIATPAQFQKVAAFLETSGWSKCRAPNSGPRCLLRHRD